MKRAHARLGHIGIVLLIVLVIVLALLGVLMRFSVRAPINRERASAVRGGAALARPDASPHGICTVLTHRAIGKTAEAAARYRETGVHVPGVVRGEHTEVVGGKKTNTKRLGEKKKPIKPWTSYSTWEALNADEGARKAYWEERNKVYENLNLDWSKVRAQLKDILFDNREWAGLINIVDGTPTVTEKIASPLRIGEGVKGETDAMVPAEVISRLESKPSMFTFHTHPHGTSSVISAQDATQALLHTYLGRTAAEVIVSPESVVMYGVSPLLFNRIWADENPYFSALRKAYDIYTALEGLRSWGKSYDLADINEIMANFDYFFITYPQDSYQQTFHNMCFSPWVTTDFAILEKLQEALKENEKPAQKAKPLTKPK